MYQTPSNSTKKIRLNPVAIETMVPPSEKIGSDRLSEDFYKPKITSVLQNEIREYEIPRFYTEKRESSENKFDSDFSIIRKIAEFEDKMKFFESKFKNQENLEQKIEELEFRLNQNIDKRERSLNSKIDYLTEKIIKFEQNKANNNENSLKDDVIKLEKNIIEWRQENEVDNRVFFTKV